MKGFISWPKECNYISITIYIYLTKSRRIESSAADNLSLSANFCKQSQMDSAGTEAIDELQVDWSNEETIRYLSAINCLHNYALGKVSDIDANPDAAMIERRKKKPAPKGFLSFSETIEQIRLMDSESVSFTREVGALCDLSDQRDGNTWNHL